MAFNTSFVITLKDRFSGTANKVARSAERMKNKISGAGRAGGDFSQKLKNNQAQLASTRASFIALAAAAAAITFPIRAAIRFEEAMAEVRKVVDFPEPDGLKKMAKTVLQLSKTIPLIPAEIASIVAAGGQLGIPTEALGEFAELVAKVSVALDVAPAVAATSFARLQNVFNITQTETIALADAINELSNSAAVSGEELIRALANKSAAAGKAMGLTANDTVALAGTFISLGVNADRVGSIIDSMARRLGDTAALSKALGQSTDKMAKQIQKSIQERGAPALIEFLEKFQKIPTAERTEVLTNVFGEFGIRLGAVIDRLDVFKKQLNITTNTTQFAGSVNREFANRMDTTGAKLKILKNRFASLGITIGNSQLPLVNFIVAGLGGLVFVLDSLAQNFPILTTLVTGLGIALIALGVGGLVFKALGAGIGIFVLKFGPKLRAALLGILKLSPALRNRIAILGPGIALTIFKGFLKKLLVISLAPGIAKLGFKIGNFLGEKILGPLLAKIAEIFPKFGKFIVALGNILRRNIIAPLKEVKKLFDEGLIQGFKQLIFGVPEPEFGTEKLKKLLQIRQEALETAQRLIPERLRGEAREKFIQTFISAEIKRAAGIQEATVPVAGGVTQGREDKLTVRLEATNGTRVESARVESNAEVDIGINNMAVAR